MENLSVQALNALLGYFEQQEDTVLWIRNKDFQRQLYLSPNFEKIWGANLDVMYQDNKLDMWFQFLHELDRQQVESQISTRVVEPGKADSLTLFRIVDPKGGTKFVSDHIFLLSDENNAHVGYAGLAKVISEQEWQQIIDKQRFTASWQKQANLKNDVMNILSKELGINQLPEQPATEPASLKNPKAGRVALMNNNQPILLTAREAECLYYLAAGKSAKQTAIALNVSPRTIVFHLDNIRNKAQCRTKIELLSKLCIDNDIPS